MPSDKPFVSSLDHLVITAKDVEKTMQFYTHVLGMEKEVFGPQKRVALKFGKQKINLHPYGNEFLPHANTPKPGSQDLCFISKTPLSSWIKTLEAKEVKVEEGPVMRTGARGPITSIYFRDPDKNLIEISNYRLTRGTVLPWMQSKMPSARFVKPIGFISTVVLLSFGLWKKSQPQIAASENKLPNQPNVRIF